MRGENNTGRNSKTYEILPSVTQDASLEIENHTLIKECRLITNYNNGTHEHNGLILEKVFKNNTIKIPTTTSLGGNISFITSAEARCEYYNNKYSTDTIHFSVKDSDEEKPYRISFDGADVKSGVATKQKAFRECQKEFENSRTLQNSIIVTCHWDRSLFLDDGGKG